ncbi:hypothetical protein FRC06_001413, partial [Ceratobasidium sp. 370]
MQDAEVHQPANRCLPGGALPSGLIDLSPTTPSGPGNAIDLPATSPVLTAVDGSQGTNTGPSVAQNDDSSDMDWMLDALEAGDNATSELEEYSDVDEALDAPTMEEDDDLPLDLGPGYEAATARHPVVEGYDIPQDPAMSQRGHVRFQTGASPVSSTTTPIAASGQGWPGAHFAGSDSLMAPSASPESVAGSEDSVALPVVPTSLISEATRREGDHSATSAAQTQQVGSTSQPGQDNPSRSTRGSRGVLSSRIDAGCSRSMDRPARSSMSSAGGDLIRRHVPEGYTPASKGTAIDESTSLSRDTANTAPRRLVADMTSNGSPVAGSMSALSEIRAYAASSGPRRPVADMTSNGSPIAGSMSALSEIQAYSTDPRRLVADMTSNVSPVSGSMSALSDIRAYTASSGPRRPVVDMTSNGSPVAGSMSALSEIRAYAASTEPRRLVAEMTSNVSPVSDSMSARSDIRAYTASSGPQRHVADMTSNVSPISDSMSARLGIQASRRHMCGNISTPTGIEPEVMTISSYDRCDATEGEPVTLPTSIVRPAAVSRLNDQELLIPPRPIFDQDGSRPVAHTVRSQPASFTAQGVPSVPSHPLPQTSTVLANRQSMSNSDFTRPNTVFVNQPNSTQPLVSARSATFTAPETHSRTANLSTAISAPPIRRKRSLGLGLRISTIHSTATRVPRQQSIPATGDSTITSLHSHPTHAVLPATSTIATADPDVSTSLSVYRRPRPPPTSPVNRRHPDRSASANLAISGVRPMAAVGSSVIADSEAHILPRSKGMGPEVESESKFGCVNFANLLALKNEAESWCFR